MVQRWMGGVEWMGGLETVQLKIYGKWDGLQK
jgi:hypothetical protein